MCPMEWKWITGYESPLQEPPTKPLANGKQDLGQDKLNTANPQHPTTSTSTASNNNTRLNEALLR